MMAFVALGTMFIVPKLSWLIMVLRNRFYA